MVEYEIDGITYKPDLGIAFQTDQSNTIDYGSDYIQNYVSYEGSPISDKLNDGRFKYASRYSSASILDIGIGSGEFIKRNNYPIYGYDINPYAVKWLKDIYRYINPYENIPRHISTLTFWDSLEHIPMIKNLFIKIPVETVIVLSIPIFEDIEKIRESKHYKPREHLYYFTESGFIEFMDNNDFCIIDKLPDFENEAGREGIKSFVFEKL